MTPARPLASRLLHLCATAGFFLAAAAQASDYGDIQQLLQRGKAGQALGAVDARLAASPRDPQLRFLRGVAQTQAGQPDAAIATFTQLTEDYPELPEPYNNLAVLYAQNNQLDQARRTLEQAIRTNPSYATAHENLGDIYAQLARQAYRQAVQLDAASAGRIQPKLALIRELFSATPRPAAAAK